ncbi:hypothetical protein [Spirulina sp. 06S082]|uniref:hypothetical protein n=1 Tax=Spirulina sp. 06S082 TaxID=3110248 RepID=UPI002B1EC115|nr:hypothetical protein [Spirulina sp. 06S082]MEA5471251.1 hypothetical protein [Spirulina sp. 06S082]
MLNQLIEFEGIFGTAFILLSGFAFVKWKSSRYNRQQEKQETLIEKYASDSSQPTAICLEISASEFASLEVGQFIEQNQIVQLINSASDILCTTVEEADRLAVDIDKFQNHSPNSQLNFFIRRKCFIRIDIPNGGEIMGKKNKYVITRDMPVGAKGKIKKLGRLRSLNGLESFNRI